MVDVTEKGASKRTAIAAGSVRTSAHVVELISSGSSGGLPKGDALATARVAGILAAKHTSDLTPLCHQLALTGVDVDFAVGKSDIDITATVRSTDRTGVEMEALTAVSVAALTLYDIKAVDPAARIDNIRVLRKEGGRRERGCGDGCPIRASHHRLHPRVGWCVGRPMRADHRRMARAAGVSGGIAGGGRRRRPSGSGAAGSRW
jgi:cyclic pyranopterin phosphate synthase